MPSLQLEILDGKHQERILDSEIIKNKDNNFCIQEPSSMGGAPGEGILTGSEDCLYLDIKTPKKKSSELLPVMFWIHGGGNTSGLKDLYDYSTMVNRHDVIVVTINYRLGAFGWFTHPAFKVIRKDLIKLLILEL